LNRQTALLPIRSKLDTIDHRWALHVDPQVEQSGFLLHPPDVELANPRKQLALFHGVDAFAAEGWIPAEGCAWNQILRRAPLQPHTRHAFELEANAEATHLRLNIYPDGGVARFRAFAPVAP
jgi:hypothetical protein